MGRLTFPSALMTVLLAVVASDSLARASAREVSFAVQAPVSRDGLVMLSKGQRVQVISGSEPVLSVRIQREERLESVAETSTGFVTAGVREQDDGSELLFIEGGPLGVRRLELPTRNEALQLRPVLLVDRGALVGAAWLEGPDPRRLRVKAADWDGAEWGPVATVSRRSPGSQTGLVGTILRGGSALLVWSQFDGQDDELFFSRHEGSGWARPERVFANNLQPDISPSVNFTRNGALLVWSRFDGTDYRLWSSRFERGRWSEERQVGGPGTLFPELIRHGDDQIFTIYRNAWPRGWSIQRAGEESGDRSRAFIPTAAGRPVLTGADRTSVTLVWPSRGKAMTRRLELVP